MRFRIRRPGSTPAVHFPEDPAPTPDVQTVEPEVVEPPLSAHETELIRASVSVVAPLAADMTVYFYAILFARYPEVRPMFPPGMDAQRDRLLRSLLRIVDLVDDPENLVRFCGHLGRDHRKFGALREHFPAVGECLLASLARYAGPAWTQDIADAWTKAYGAVADVMISAAEQDAKERPAVWPATIVHLLPCGNGIAEVTLRPHLPYEHAAGQFVSIETPGTPSSGATTPRERAPRGRHPHLPRTGGARWFGQRSAGVPGSGGRRGPPGRAHGRHGAGPRRPHRLALRGRMARASPPSARSSRRSPDAAVGTR